MVKKEVESNNIDWTQRIFWAFVALILLQIIFNWDKVIYFLKDINVIT